MRDIDQQIGLAMRAIDDTWGEFSRALPPFYRALGLPRVSVEDALRRSKFGRELVTRIDGIDSTALPAELHLTLQVARLRAGIWANEHDWYWTAFDPSGVGFFALFSATAYSGGWLLNNALTALQGFVFTEGADCDRYLALVTDYARLVDQLTERTRGQTARGIRLPKLQAQEAGPLLTRLRVHSQKVLIVSEERLANLRPDRFIAELARRVTECVVPAFDAFIAEIGPDYIAGAPETVGMAQLPDGADIYAALVKLHTTLDLTPGEVHAIGLTRMTDIRSQMREVLADDGFDGDEQAYRAKLDADPRWRAEDAAGVAAFFQTYIDRIRPHLDMYFSFGPKAGYGVRPLPEALEASMTFGFYDSPKPDRSDGLYLFNAANLTKAGLYNLGALTYHELVPGHHFHFATQRENAALHRLRSHSSFNAYNEGWAEYAATLAGEMGLYPTPAERFGRLVMEAFLACRLVVDTGMNALGWSLERARDYMRENSFMPETEIRSESLRYSCDMPGQALPYELGKIEIMKMREEMRAALDDRFDIRDFHRAVLRPGGLPLRLLAAEVAGVTERLKVQAKE